MSYTLCDYKRLAASPRTIAYTNALKRAYKNDNEAVLLDIGTGSVMCFSVIGRNIGFQTFIAIERCPNAYRHAMRYYAPKFDNMSLHHMCVLDLTEAHLHACIGKTVVVVHEFFDNLASAENAHILLKHVSTILSSLGVNVVYVPHGASTVARFTDIVVDEVELLSCEHRCICVPFCMKNTRVDCNNLINTKCEGFAHAVLETIDFVRNAHDTPFVYVTQPCEWIVLSLCIHFDEYDYTISDGDTWNHIMVRCVDLTFPLKLRLEVISYMDDHPLYTLHMNDKCIKMSSIYAWSHVNAHEG